MKIKIIPSCGNCYRQDVKCLYCDRLAQYDGDGKIINRHFCEGIRRDECFFVKAGCNTRRDNPEITWCEYWSFDSDLLVEVEVGE